MTSSVIDYLRDLAIETGVSGSEHDVIAMIARQVRPLVDTVEIDAFGNVIAVRNGTGANPRRCVLAAHMDEIGFRVRKIEDGGYLRFEKAGGSDNRILLAQRVWVQTARGRLLGVIGTRSAHLLREADRTTVQPHTELYIDIGARDAAHARAMGVEVGDAIGFQGDLAELGADSGRYTAHALDDRAGCAVVLALLDRLQGQDVSTTIVALFTVQEEIGLRGAQAATHGMDADLALAIDTTAVDDTPDTGTFHLVLGGGPPIKVMDFSTVAHPALTKGLYAAAERLDLAVQREILSGIGTDAGAMQYGGRGTPAGAISIGTRYTHSPVEVFDAQELEDTVRLLEEFVRTAHDLDLRFTSIQ